MKTKSLLVAGFLALLASPLAGQDAARLYQQLCDDGDMLGCDLLGVMYREGQGVTENLTRAAELFQQACDGDMMASCGRLGVMYANGVGVPQDFTRGLDLSQQACEGGDTQGCANFELLMGMMRTAVLGQLPVEDRELTIGALGLGSAMESGTLSAADPEGPLGSYVQAWALTLRAGQKITADLTSGDFDSYLMVTGPGLVSALSDDDSGGGCGARITFTAPEDGEYRAIVSAANPGATGAFLLRAGSTPPITAFGPCRRSVSTGAVVLAGRTNAVVSPVEPSSNLIVRAQIEQYSGRTALEVIQRFNSRWLRSTRIGGVSPGSAPAVARVSLDGATPGDLGDLETIPADNIEYMGYLTATEATTRYGTGFDGGVIEVFSRGR